MILMRLILLVLLFLFSFSEILSQNLRIFPKPQEKKIEAGAFILNTQKNIVIVTEKSTATAIFLQKHIHDFYGFKIEIIESDKSKKDAINFRLDCNLAEEEYELSVSGKQINITASNAKGWFYGIQSLIQIFPTHKNESVSEINIPAVSIKDYPRFKWRAFMLDEARYFKGMNQVKMLLDEMAFLKMNVFHWHLVDDQGWRIEIKKYPLLTQIGSKRKSTQIGPLKWDSPIQSAEPHEGFYTQEEITEIIEYAKERHITIVPEIEMPGHSSAAIAAYPWLGTNKNKIEVPIKFGVGKDVYDVSDPKVYKFLTDVLDEVIALFPSEVIHIGGDEVKYNHWKESTTVKAYMKENKLSTPAELQIFFTNSISQYLQKKGKRMMGWNEILGHNLHKYQDESDTKSNLELAKQTVVHFWKGDVALATHAANKGYEIVNSLCTETYLDYSYADIALSKAYAFEPIPSELDPKFHNKVIGIGCQMWGEWIPTNGQMHFMVFPRIAAYAEVGWTEPVNKDYKSFKEAINKLEKRWQNKGIYYAPLKCVDNLNE